jgi:hypothetical protein
LTDISGTNTGKTKNRNPTPTQYKGAKHEHENDPQMDKGRQHRPILSGIR